MNARALAASLERRISRDAHGRSLRAVARQLGVEVWLVGGSVRDPALGRPARDLDLIAGRGAPKLVRELDRLWGHRGFRFTKRGVTTWRWEIDGRRVDLVDAARRGLEGDLARRELTVNAIAFDLVRARIEDPLGGLADLRRRRLRLPRPGVMREDPVRALRLARFLAELEGFEADEQATGEARAAARGLARASVERVREELERMLVSRAPQRGLTALVDLGLLRAVLPEMEPTRHCVAGGDRPDVWTHTLATLEQSTRTARLPGRAALADPASLAILRWSLLLHDIAKPDTFEIRDGRPTFHGHEALGAERVLEILTRLRSSVRERRRIERLVLWHLRPSQLAEAGSPRRGLARLVRDAGDDLPLLVLHALFDARGSGGPAQPARYRRLFACSRELLALAEERRRRPRPRLVGGRALLEALEIEPGPLVGRLLRAIEEEQDEGRLTNAAEAIAFARKRAAALAEE